jgi:hypothetical protein
VAKPFELADELTLVVLGGLALLEVVVAQLLVGERYDLKLWTGPLLESATYPPA